MTRAVLARSKCVGVVLGMSVIKSDSTNDEVKPFYSGRDVRKPIAELLTGALGDRFENRRNTRDRRT
jgi:hypothetical protein